MSKSIQLKNNENEKMYPHPYYPIGSIYLSVNDINPSKWFGGTWEQIAKGRTLVGVDTSDTDFNIVKKTGGEKTHKLTINEMPSHNHNFKNKDYDPISILEPSGNNTWYGINTQVGMSNYTFDISNTGGSQAHNNLQPYFTCYIWCRTA